MTILIFIIILGILVLVHEMGHFLVAKKAGVRVDEFGFGYPPRALILGKWRETIFSLNWIPFGGFVKILGENYEPDQNINNENNLTKTNLRFTEISKKWQAGILIAGVSFNILFACILFSIAFMFGIPAPVDGEFKDQVKNPILTVVGLLENYPAEKSGIKHGDKINKISFSGNELVNPNINNFSGFIAGSNSDLNIEILRGKDILNFKIKQTDILSEGKKVIGVNVDMVGEVKLSFVKSIIEGFKTSFKFTYLTIIGLFDLLRNLIFGEADMSNISGPVGIVGLVGEASDLGFVYLITFTALISINLAVINLVPFPALDGGRLLFVGIEAILRKPINPKFIQIINSAGFVILLILMLIVTYKDIVKLI